METPVFTRCLFFLSVDLREPTRAAYIVCFCLRMKEEGYMNPKDCEERSCIDIRSEIIPK